MSEPLAELFSSRVRAAVLALLLSRPHLAFSLTDLSRRLGLPVSSLQHECYKLTRLGLLRDERIGNARRYRPNPHWPLFEPLTALIVQAMPLRDALQGAIERVSGIDEAWVTGNFKAAREPVYLVVVGRLDVEEIDGVFNRAQVALAPLAGPGRVELAYFPSADWAARVTSSEPFAASLLADPLVVLSAPGRNLGHDASGHASRP